MNRVYEIAAIAAVASERQPGYLEAVLAAGKVVGDTVELTQADWEEIRAKYWVSEAAHDWPIWAVVASLFRSELDTGLGDTVARELGGTRSEGFKRHHELLFGLWAKPCGCAGQVARWNALFPYP
jgi:hypothetical protein